MKKYTLDELYRFCERAVNTDRVKEATDFIKSRPYLTESEKGDLIDYMNMPQEMDDYPYEENPFLPDYMDRDSRDYGPSNPWDAPGMRVSDFITGVRFY